MNHTKGPLRTAYQGKVFAIKECDVTFADGTTTVYEFCERPASVSVLAFNKKNQILLLREKRHEYNGWTWFLPGGRMDHPGDTPRKAAIRELREEGGFRAKTLKMIHKKSPSASLLWNIYVFAARDLVIDPLPLDKSEEIIPIFMPLKKAVSMALDGTIDNEFISYNLIRFDHMLKSGQFHWDKK